MPPAKKRATLAPTPDGDWTREVPVNYTSFKVPPMINAKNVLSTYLKTDAQTWIARAAAATPGKDAESKKRKKGKEPAVDDDDASEDDDEADEDGEREGRMAASNTIVIHPGSSTLRIGRATDLNPLSYPFVLARKVPPRAQAESRSDDSAALSPGGAKSERVPSAGPANGHAAHDGAGPGDGAEDGGDDDDAEEEDKNDTLSPKIDIIRQDLRSIMRALKLRPVSNGRQLAASYNETSAPEVVPEHSDVSSFEWVEPRSDDDVIIGEQALRMSCFSPAELSGASAPAAANGGPSNGNASRQWRLFHPYKRGMLNVDEYVEQYGAGSAMSVLLGDLQTFLERVLAAPRIEDLEDEQQAAASSGTLLTGLGIPRSRWSSLNIVLVVPDLPSRAHMRLLAHMLLTTMQFAGLCLQNEGVAATFGAGMSSACVVDLGAEAISISCVDDGLVVPESRIQLSFGGEDITLFFRELLRRAKMPYRTLDMARRIADKQIVEDLKHRSLTLHPSEIGLNFYDFQLRLPGRPTEKYKLRMYDEPIVGPLMLFAPRVVDFERKRGPRTPRRALPMPEQADDDVEDPGEAAEPDIAETVTMLRTVDYLVAPARRAAEEAWNEEQERKRAEAEAAAATAAAAAAAEASARASPAAGAVPGSASIAPGASRDGLATAGGTPAPPETAGGATAAGTPVPFAAPAPAFVAAPAPALSAAQLGVDVHWESSKTPLDVAVWASILGSTHMLIGLQSTEERIRRMSQNILCVGGGALIPGLGAALEARVNVHMDNHVAATAAAAAAAAASSAQPSGPGGSAAGPAAALAASGGAIAAGGALFGGGSGNVPTATAIPAPRDMDPRTLAWKGSAVLARLDSAAELRTRRKEWEELNWKAVRERTIWL